MGTMTRLEMFTEIKENLDNREDVTATQGNRWINHAYHHLMCHTRHHPVTGFRRLLILFSHYLLLILIDHQSISFSATARELARA